MAYFLLYVITMKRIVLLTVLFTAAIFAAAFGREPYSSFKVVDSLPHDTTSEIQGLDYFNGRLYESTCNPTDPALMEIYPATGDTLIIKHLDKYYEPQGVTVVGDKIVQLTFKAIIGFVYDLYSFTPLDTFELPIVEGVGVTFDGEKLILSDGTSFLVYVDTSTYEQIGKIRITDDGKPVNFIAEMDYGDSLLFATPLPSLKVAVIAPQTGEVLQWLDLSLVCHPPPGECIFGLAWDKATATLLVTGPRWPWIYRLELIK